MAKDLLQDRYGRFYEIPRILNESGHQVFIACLSYRAVPEPGADCLEPLEWQHHKLGLNPCYGLYRYNAALNETVKTFKPDIIIGASDSFHVILAAMLAKKYQLPYIADLYDNFESYKATLFPGIRTLFYKAIKNADGVSVVSDALHEYICTSYNPEGKVSVVGNAIVPGLFYHRDKVTARKNLQLPRDGYFIGTAGALYKQRGIMVLYEAFRQLLKEHENVHLVLAGSIDSHVHAPELQNVHYLGELEHERIPVLFSALDLGVICNLKSQFGLYCFPQKAYEMLACHLPVVAADVGAMSKLLAGCPTCLYEPESPASLINAVKQQIQQEHVLDIEVPSWQEQTEKLMDLINSVVS